MKPWHLLSILALCVALVATVPAASASYDHPFILKWGERGIDTPGEFSNPKYVAVDSVQYTLQIQLNARSSGGVILVS